MIAVRMRVAAVLALVLATLVPSVCEARGGYGGPRYTASTDFPTTIALLDAGGGPERFSPAWALRKLVGHKLVDDEIATLNASYGPPDVREFFTVFKFAMDDAARLERDYRVHYPPPALSGPRLASQVFRDGVVGRRLETGYLFDHLFTPRVTDRVLSDIDRVYGSRDDENFQRIGDALFVDLARVSGIHNIEIASADAN